MSDPYTQRLAEQAIEDFQRRKEEEKKQKKDQACDRAGNALEAVPEDLPLLESAQHLAQKHTMSMAEEVALHAGGKVVAQKACCLAEASMEALGGTSCFVATASLGSDQHPDLTDLRAFRDQKLLPFTMGRWFVRFYYQWGQHMANAIRHKPFLCWMVREGFVKPLARFARYCLKS